MRILITGSTGFLGERLIQKLKTSSHEIMVMTRKKSSKRISKNVKVLVADLSELSSYSKPVKNFAPEIIIDMAWEGIPNFTSKISLTNKINTSRFLDFVTDLDSCKKILVAGSCLEFGQSLGPCNEENVGIPNDYFSLAKHSIRNWLDMKCQEKNISYAWFRIFYVYGPYQRSSSILPTLMDKFQKGDVPNLKTPYRANDYVYIDDIINAFFICLNKKFNSGIYNLGSGKSISVLELCKTVERVVYGSTETTRELIKTLPPYDKNEINFWASTTKSQKNLSWKAEINLREGIKKMFKEAWIAK